MSCVSTDDLNILCEKNKELLGKYLTYKKLMDD